jgi:pimeloyl-ACP methyl ester carboxylesterase
LAISLFGCTTPKKSVRIDDRLWLENDYTKRLETLKANYRTERILTRFGHTQVLISGENNKEVIFLLHAMGLNSTVWIPNIEILSKYYKIIAVDAIGDQGRSVVRRDYPENIREYSLWLNDIVEYFGFNKINIVGNSMGGWIAHGYAIHYPEKIETLTLISPAAGIPAKTTWLGLILKMVSTNDERKLQKIAKKILGNHQAGKDWIEYMGKASKDYKSAKLGMPKNFSDDELRKTGGRVQLLVGDSETIYKSTEKVFAKAKAVIPAIECKIIPNAGHVAGWDNPNFVNNEIIDFIELE